MRHFCSSSVSPEPSSTSAPAKGTTLKAIGSGKTDGLGKLDRAAVVGERRVPAGATSRICSSSSVDASEARPRDRLVGRDDDALAAPPRRASGLRTGIATIVVQFGLATMPFGIDESASGVHLGDDERDVGIHAPRRRVVDDDRPLAATCGARSSDADLPAGKEGEVETGEIAPGRRLRRRRHVPERDAFPPSERTRRSASLGRELALVEEAPHDPADLASRSEHADVHRPKATDEELRGLRSVAEPERLVQHADGIVDRVARAPCRRSESARSRSSRC